MVRELGLADWGGVWPLVRGFGTEFSEEVSRGYFEELVGDPRWVALGFEVGGELVGYAVVQDYGTHLRGGRRFHGRLHDLYVVPDRRRGGVGRGLMAAVVEWAAPRVRYLEWQAHAERAAPFYEALGYRGEPCPQSDYPTFGVEFST
ncbi:GNAT family N-acetyltransferase [Kribbella sp. NPDC026611]|uniref:GNAT family N-acetyltransferase n=1 Tax=Kribbella sp. NPDC026611 TaxID=3154911 RepID=UPI0033E7EEB3